MLTSAAEVKEFLREKIKSGEWWILLPEQDCSYLIAEIEAKFYSGDASADFAAILGMSRFGLFSIYAARKFRMSARGLIDIIGDRSPMIITVDQLRERDIVFFAGYIQAQVLMTQLAELVGQLESERR